MDSRVRGNDDHHDEHELKTWQSCVNSASTLPAGHEKTKSFLQLGHRKLQTLCGRDKPLVITRQRHLLPLPPEEFHRREMQCVQYAHRCGKRLEGAIEYRPCELHKRDAAEKTAHRLIVRTGDGRTRPRDSRALQGPLPRNANVVQARKIAQSVDIGRYPAVRSLATATGERDCVAVRASAHPELTSKTVSGWTEASRTGG